MKTEDVVKTAVTIFVGLVLIRASLDIIGFAAQGFAHLSHNRKLKKGLKDGSIVKVNGEYWEVVKETEA